MTEIPEHLLNRSKARRADASGDASGDSAPSSTPAVATPATPAKAAEAPAPKPVVADPPYVAAAKSRKKIPFWAMAGLALLPAWAALAMELPMPMHCAWNRVVLNPIGSLIPIT